MPPRKRTVSAPKSEPEEAPELLTADEDIEQPDDTSPATERSDLQTVDTPCPDCFPGGWPEHAFAVGCTHGTWKRG